LSIINYYSEAYIYNSAAHLRLLRPRSRSGTGSLPESS
jgi:hypothetical protein